MGINLKIQNQIIEKKLMTDSTANDLIPVPFTESKNIKQDANKILTQKQAKEDISIFARTIINAYCGWPFYSEELKTEILINLEKIYNSINTDIPIKKLFNELGNIIKLFPDNHIRIFLGDNWYSRSEPAKKTVGENISRDNLITRQNGIGIIAIPHLNPLTPEQMKKLQDEIIKLKDTSSLLIDLRGNRGGNSAFTDWIAKQIFGYETPSCKRAYIRATDEAKILNKSNQIIFKRQLNNSENLVILFDNSEIKTPDKIIYNSIIYLLIDRSVASVQKCL